MSLGRYRIPKEIKDEDKWFKFFTKTQLLYVGIGGLLSGFFISLANTLHILPVGIVIAEFIMVVAIVIAFVKIPKDRYLIGGGLPIRVILLRLIEKNIPANKKIYLKGINKRKDEMEGLD